MINLDKTSLAKIGLGVVVREIDNAITNLQVDLRKGRSSHGPLKGTPLDGAEDTRYELYWLSLLREDVIPEIEIGLKTEETK